MASRQIGSLSESSLAERQPLSNLRQTERTWLSFGGKCGFYVSGDTVRDSFPEGKGAEWTDGIIWHYFAKNTGDPIPKESSFDSVYEQLLHCYRGILDVCMDFEDQLSLGGDELTTVIYELEWPEVLLYLGLKQAHPLLRVEHDSVLRSFQSEELIPFGAAEDWHNVFRICPSSVVRATSYALETLRRMFNEVDASAAGGESIFRSKGDNMSNNSSSIVVSNILTPLANDVEKERRLMKVGEAFDQRNKETIEHDRDELRRSGILAADWTPNETNVDHGYWDKWSERLRKVADELEAACEAALAGQLLTFCSQIDGRDEVTCENDFRFEKLAEWLTAVMAGDKQEVSETLDNEKPAQDGPVPPDAFRWNGNLCDGCPGIAWRLLDALWKKDNKTSKIEDLKEPVWHEHSIAIDENQIGDVRKKVNKFLKEHKIPFQVSKKGEFITLKTRNKS